MTKAFVDTSVILRILIKDDDLKAKAAVNLLKSAGEKDLILYLLPVAVLETVWVLEKVYAFPRKAIREVVEAILNTPELKVEQEAVFRKALKTYVEKNIKFADAVMGYWGLDKGYTTVFTYDEKDFKRIEGLESRKP
jgi:predicted nucleic-acid-binding protein